MHLRAPILAWNRLRAGVLVSGVRQREEACHGQDRCAERERTRDVRDVWEAQETSLGAVQPNTPVYALRPSILRGMRALSAGINESGLLDEELKDLVSLRAALINGCRF